MYIAEIWQIGGCDYSIECGTKVLRIPDASTIEEAKKNLREIIERKYSSEETQLSGARIYEVVHHEEVEIDDIYLSIEQKRKEESLKYIEQKELEQYERLKSKFENK